MKLKENRTFFKGAMSLSLSVILTKILGVAFKVPLSYILTDEGMGYFNTAYAIYGLFYILCTAGVPKSLMLVKSLAFSGCKNLKRVYISKKCTIEPNAFPKNCQQHFLIFSHF